MLIIYLQVLMTRIKNNILFLFIVLSVSLSAKEYSINDVPNPKTADVNNFVSNPDGILNYATVEQINTMLQSLETDTKAEVAVVLLNSIGSADIFDFGLRLFEKWGIGKKKLDNGLLILFVLDQRSIRFEVGYGLEGVLPDGICKRIQTQAMTPEFKNGNYDAGMIAGIELAINCIRKEPLPETFSPVYDDSIAIIPIIILYVILASIFLSKENKKVKKINNDNSLINNQQRYEAYIKTKTSESCIIGTGCILPVLGFFLLFSETNIGIALIFSFLTLIPLFMYRNKWKKKFRWQSVTCPTCGKEINVLPQTENNKYLDLKTNMEDTLKSFFVDVFLCKHCNEMLVYKYENNKSPYKKCTQCETKAMYLAETKTILRATYTNDGKKEQTYICKYCEHKETKEKIIPHLTHSSSGGSYGSSGGSSSSSGSSGGSYGGGRSGGGGSTSKW